MFPDFNSFICFIQHNKLDLITASIHFQLIDSEQFRLLAPFFKQLARSYTRDIMQIPFNANYAKRFLFPFFYRYQRCG